MDAPLLPLLAAGFLLGWSVAWPPGPINAESARRCLAGGFWAGFSLLLGACSGDALWAVLVSLGIGVLFVAPLARSIIGGLGVSVVLTVFIVPAAFLLVYERREQRKAGPEYSSMPPPEPGGAA